MNYKTKRFIGSFAKYAVLLVASIVVVFPVYWMILTALTENGSMLSNTSVIPDMANMTTFNFEKVMQGNIWKWLVNSLPCVYYHRNRV